MNTKEIKIAINSVHQLEDEAWVEFEKSLRPRFLSKGEIIWSSGDVCNYVVFMNTGLIRNFSEVERKIVTHQFFSKTDCLPITIVLCLKSHAR